MRLQPPDQRLATRGVEKELDGIVEDAGETPLDTPSGTLRRVVDGGVRRFLLEV